MSKLSVITGLGQDSFYLAKYLLSLGHEVVCVKRRSSVDNGFRFQFLQDHPKLIIESGDITDISSIERIVREYQPDEFYNLAAQSFVRDSFNSPISTAQITGLGALNCLEAIRLTKLNTKFYQASSSEMMGDQINKDGVLVLNEKSRLQSRSPYATAKLFAHYSTINYREAFGLYSVNGVLFNHSCFDLEMPIITRTNKRVDIVRIKDLFSNLSINPGTYFVDDIEVWDGTQWSQLNAVTIRESDNSDDNFDIQVTNTRNGVLKTTKHHNLLDEDGNKIKAKNVTIEQELLHGRLPNGSDLQVKRYQDLVSEEEAEFIGILAGDGYVSPEYKIQIGLGAYKEEYTQYYERMKFLWNNISKGNIKLGKIYSSSLGSSRLVHCYDVTWARRLNLRSELYNNDKYKKVPSFILNGSNGVKLAFLRGYNLTDGLKKNPCTYEFKNFKTDSIHLAQGLLFLSQNVLKQVFNITYEDRIRNGKYETYYSINLLSPDRNNKEKELKVLELVGAGLSQRKIERETSISRSFIRKIQNGGHACIEHHLEKPKYNVKKVLFEEKRALVADLCIESGRVMIGVGTIIAANSPLRGEEFVERKITKSVALLKHKIINKVAFGNLDSRRDYTAAEDCVRAMHLMLQQAEPKDYVIGSGKAYSPREILHLAAEMAGLPNIEQYIEIDPKFYRPTEVNVLISDPSLAKKELGWEPRISFESLIESMVRFDLLYFDPILSEGVKLQKCKQLLEGKKC